MVEPVTVKPILEHTLEGLDEDTFTTSALKEDVRHISIVHGFNDGHVLTADRVCLLGRVVTDPVTGPVHLVVLGWGVQLVFDPVTHVGVLHAVLPQYTFATLPDPVPIAGRHVTVSDRGYKPAYSDGTVWRFIHDNSAVS